MSRSRVAHICAVSSIIVILWGGCAPAKVTTQQSPALKQYDVRKVVILPFGRVTTPQIIDAGRLARETSVPAMVPDRIANMVFRKLEKRGGLEVLPPQMGGRVMKQLGDVVEEWEPQRVAAEAARLAQADAALLGRVLVYQEREGSRWGASPAAVGFDLQLVARDGTILWEGNYYEWQRPLNEDVIGFIQHGGGFVTAEELAEYGAERLARRFPFGIG